MIRKPRISHLSLVEIVVITCLLMTMGTALWPQVSALEEYEKAQERARQTTCTSNLRQLSMAVTMFVQDNKSRYPGMYALNADGSVSGNMTGWAKEVVNYVGGGDAVDKKSPLFNCPEMPDPAGELPISYGYSALLLKNEGTGLNEAAVKQPTQVGVLCDAGPGMPFALGGGIIGGSSLALNVPNLTRYTVTPAPRHQGNVIVGYADGHAAMVPNGFDARDSTNGVTRSFYQANALRVLDNSAGGLPNFPVKNTYGDFITIGGDQCTKPLLEAACEAWKRKNSKFTYAHDGFSGSRNQDPTPADYLCGDGGGLLRGAHTCPIARDAMVVIVNKSCTISDDYIGKDQHGGGMRIAASLLRHIFNSDGYAALQQPNANQHDWQVYLPSAADGTRVYLDRELTPTGYGFTIPDGYHDHGNQDTYRGVFCQDDWDIVDKVAGDPLGIGVVSAAAADTRRINILSIQTKDKLCCFPNDDGSGVYPFHPTWPYMRTLYVRCFGNTWRKAGDGIANVMLKPGGTGARALLAGPMFKASYWAP